MEKITIWKQKKNIKDDRGNIIDVVYNHNHIESGWVKGDKPQPLKEEFANQLAWNNFEWKHEYAYLSNGKVVHMEQ